MTFSVVLGSLLAACSVGEGVDEGVQTPASATRTPVPTATSPVDPPAVPAMPVRTDQQGVVEFEVRPLRLEPSAETIEFEVVMNTHSVDLSWDLAALSVLRTNHGVEVGATGWPIGGGHHYGGILEFPVTTVDGRRVLEGAQSVTLVIRDTDVAERVFTWDLRPE